MLTALVSLSVRFRLLVLAALVVMLGAGGYAVTKLPVDAVPDISTIQVSVLTDSPGLSAREVERTVTFPVENALNGVPGMVQLRSVSRAGLSAVTVIFRDGTDPWFARQLVLERIRGLEKDLPSTVSTPELGPLSTGLGEIFYFVVKSPHHSPSQLRTILDWEIVPRLRGIPGVIEVNTMGGRLKQYHVVVDPTRLHAYRLSISDVQEAVERANVNVGGGYLERGSEALTLRGVGLLKGETDIENVVVSVDERGTPVLIRQIAQVKIGAALPYGAITRDGEGEAVMGCVLMLLGSNSRNVIYAVKDRVDQIQKDLPPGVEIQIIYDRADFVERTIATVLRNLVEGAIVVFVVLAIFLGTIRGALVVVVGIPASMAIAIFGMLLTGTQGNLMSLGAIDFGFLVDGPVVMLEAVMASLAGTALQGEKRVEAFKETISAVARPVAFAVAIIMLVYIPLLALEGVEGKMFKPMATTMAAALFGALVYSVVFFPALTVLFVPPPANAHGGWLSHVERVFEFALPRAVAWRWRLLGSASLAVVGSFMLMLQNGADFVPRIDEGDLIVAVRRPPSVSLSRAKELDLETERILKGFPEVTTTLGLVGRAEIATDPQGVDNTDIFVHLKPKEEWTTAHDLDSLAVALKNAVEGGVPSTFVAVSQPIEDRTNSMISGSRAHVVIAIDGSDLLTLKDLSEQIGAIVADIDGTGDLRVERMLGAPELNVELNRQRLARYGIRAEDALQAVQAARVGVDLGVIYEEQRRFGLRLLVPPRNATADALGDLFVVASDGTPIPLAEVANIVEAEGPSAIRREMRSRTIRVEVNLRGRDLVSWVAEAKQKVAEKVELPSGYKLRWGGQFENFERASQRLAVVASLALVIIFLMLAAMFGDLRYATAVFATVPFALTGGALGLWIRGMSFSIPAAVGFIALAGVSVLNGVVMATDVRNRAANGEDAESAILHGAAHTMRAVLTTGAVAALGFMPMALAHSAGAEVQRPLATVVVFGIGLATILTLFMLPGLLRIVMAGEVRRARRPVGSDSVALEAEVLDEIAATSPVPASDPFAGPGSSEDQRPRSH